MIINLHVQYNNICSQSYDYNIRFLENGKKNSEENVIRAKYCKTISLYHQTVYYEVKMYSHTLVQNVRVLLK